MTTHAQSDQQLTKIVGRIFSDESFAHALEKDPHGALKQAGFTLDDKQIAALKAPKHDVRNLAADDLGSVAITRPVVSVLTKGTKPAVNVVVSSAVVANKPEAE